MPHWVALAKVEDCPPGESLECVAQGRIVALFHVDDEFFALDGICPHQGGPLGKGRLCGSIVTCPWHGFQFDVCSGVHQTTPQLRQPTLSARVEDGQVWVDLESDAT